MTWDGSRVRCDVCGRESPSPQGLAKHVRKHGLSLYEYYADGRLHELLDRVRRTSDEALHAPELGPCWVVRGRVDGSGDKSMRVAGAPTAAAHRLALWASTGELPGEEVLALHACDVRVCANPAHLRWGTHGENMAERSARERVTRGADVHTAVLDDEAAAAIRALHAELDVSYPTLADAFGLRHRFGHAHAHGRRRSQQDRRSAAL